MAEKHPKRTADRPRRKNKNEISLTVSGFPPDLVEAIEQKTHRLDITRSKYFRDLARRDLAA